MVNGPLSAPATRRGRPPAGGFSAGEPAYVFGYGSLMWSPGFVPEAVHPARVFGWHRRFSRVSTTSWGSPDAPGLCAALHPGGTAWGRLLRIAGHEVEAAMAYLDARESAYRRRRVRLAARIGGRTVRVEALTYVADPADPTLAAALDPALARRYARHGIGAKGASFDYIRNTMLALAEDGHSQSDAHRFFAMIAA